MREAFAAVAGLEDGELASTKRAAWVADRVEAEVQAAERDATVSAAEQKVLHLLTPEVMKGQILQGLDQRRLQPGETPREYVEALKSQIQQVMPELTAESLDRMTIVQAIKGAPEVWSHKLGEGDLSSLDQLVTHMTLLHGKQRSAARRCQETGRSEVREPAATVCRCVVTDGAVEDFEDSLDEEVMPFLDQVKTQADLSHLSTVDQEKLKAVLDQSDIWHIVIIVFLYHFTSINRLGLRSMIILILFILATFARILLTFYIRFQVIMMYYHLPTVL
ncbi:hypothetical protein FJT64_023963 [Amphibalanus amphitrite]|uniref:Uncharacterized protein n=1 Tax=Amphibalanus amphitrite TaxID=1232801 RepID=A0A6A4WQ24_AMPAM|nr:hypothetical protein FJT64_023963 [Amphibalanus amphitrite]